MKRIVLFVMAMCLGLNLIAQEIEPFCCVKQGAELKYVTTDAKGNETGTSTTKVTAAAGSDGNYNIAMTITLYVNGNQMFNPMNVTTTVTDGNASVALGGGAAIEMTTDVPLIPARLAVGLELGTGTIVMNMGGIKTTQEIHTHKVVGREQLTTPAGTFDCYIVEQTYTAKMAFIKAKGSQKVWYARGIGNVKTETYDKRGKLSTQQILVSATGI